MPCFLGMKRSFLQGLLWLYLYGFGFMVLSLEPGFLDFDNLPDTNFTCVGKVIGGYYADLETNCQMFHVCTIGQLDEPMDIRFLCLNGTVFDQETRVCERIDEVDCTKSEQFYSLNLELYGHSQSSNLEENSETEQPLIIKSTAPTTTTTTTTPPPKKTTRAPFYTTSGAPPTVTTPRTNPHHISTHHFPILNPSASDIRFNPEEINISLHPGAPPDIRSNKGPVSYYSDKKITNSNTNSNSQSDKRLSNQELTASSSTQKSHRFNSGTPSGYGFAYRYDESAEFTEPPESYRIHTDFKPRQVYAADLHHQEPQRYHSSTYHTPTTQKNNNFQQKSSTTLRNYYVQSYKPSESYQQSHYGEIKTEKSPERVQLPLPALPTLPTLTFSSPAPFSLQQKRYTKDQLPPPRVVVSASASVSDGSGRKLNFSLGTIRSPQIAKPPPNSYDEYKDEDVALDPFYLDVPKVKGERKKRSTDQRKINYSEIIKNDEEALNVLKFLFDWYKNEKTNPARATTPLTTPLDNEAISSINHGLAPQESAQVEEVDDGLNFKFDTNESFKKTDYRIDDDDGISVTRNVESKVNKVEEKFTIEHTPDELFNSEEDYVNDNYEPLTYKHDDEDRKSKYWGHKEDYEDYHTKHDYVDDNIEPIYYKERNKSKTHSNFNDVFNIKDISKSKHSSHEVTTEHPDEPISTILTTERTTTTLRSRSNRRGNRKFADVKLQEKPHRAKEDYDYLRSINVYNPTSTPSYTQLQTETEYIPTVTETPSVTMSSSMETETNIDEIDDTSSYTLTSVPITSTQRTSRGRLRFGDTSVEETQGTIRKKSSTTTAPTVTEHIEDIIEVYATSFVPTTESSHHTKKKQLKVDTTTEKIEETTTWSTPELKKFIKSVESNTNSIVAPKGHKKEDNEKSIKEDKTLQKKTTTEIIQSTEDIDINTTVAPKDFIEINTESNTKTTENDTDINTTVAVTDTYINQKKTTTEIIKITEDVDINTTLPPKFYKKLEPEDINTTQKETTTDDIDVNTTLPPKESKKTTTEFDASTQTTIINTSTESSKYNMTLVDIAIENNNNDDDKTTVLDFNKEMNDFITKLDLNSIEEEDTTTTTDTNKYTQTATTIIDETTMTTNVIDDVTQPTTTIETTTIKHRRRGGKPSRRRPKTYHKPSYRHRFSTDSFTRRPKLRKQTIEEEIVDILQGKGSTTESYVGTKKKGYVLTDYPLRKSVNPTPTQAEAERDTVTTPFSQRPPPRHFFFNCFGKEIDRFYPDLRDCRLFHYCTQGYSKNQLLDMKFVCDFNTYFDDEKLICTKTKPKRCL